MKNSQTDKLMWGKVCLVTGATAGIGKVTATALAAQGAEVVIARRNQSTSGSFVTSITIVYA